MRLFAIDEIQASTIGLGYAVPLSVEFLKANDKLALDTQFFDQEFKARLLASIENFDEQCDGLLVHSENFQALGMLQSRYNQQIKCVYIDPPYNTAASEIIYKNSYKHSSWLSLLENRIESSKSLLRSDGVLEVAIDDAEFYRLNAMMNQLCGAENHIANVAIMHNPKGREQNYFSDAHEYTLLFAKDKACLTLNRLLLSDKDVKQKYPKTEGAKRYRELPLRRRGTAPFREDRPYMYFPFIFDPSRDSIDLISVDEYRNIYDGINFDDEYLEALTDKYGNDGKQLIFPIREDGRFGRWRWGFERCSKGVKDKLFFIRGKDSPTIYHKDYAVNTMLPKSIWFDVRYDASTKGTNILKDIVPSNSFDYPKSVFAVEDMIHIGSDVDSIILDYFAGSGTTGHAIANLARRDEQNRKYILVEMGEHFSKVLKPRICRVFYCDNWKKGRPTSRETGISQCFKYIRLESYEDTLNNLRFDDNATRQQTIAANAALKEHYLLNYLLDVETRGSQSLLNIDAFVDPTAYTLKVKKPGTDEVVERTVDLLETFNYLIGLRVNHIAAPQSFSADFERLPDPELPQDQHTKLVVSGRIRQDEAGPWWFRKVEGWVPKDPANPNNGQQEKVLIVWRKLTGDLEKDNLMLDEWFQRNRVNPRDFEFDTIYVNGSNNLPNLKLDEETWKVRLTEEAFMQRMWAGEGA